MFRRHHSRCMVKLQKNAYGHSANRDLYRAILPMIQYHDKINSLHIFLNQIVSFVDHELTEYIYNIYD